jgi:glycine/D-amino acid oxidase-like deaminating enzyme
MTNEGIAIIGAGIHGASAAFHLASLGARPVVFDSRGVASGPTGRSSAVCRAYYTNGFLARCARDSIEMMRNFSDLTGGRDAVFRETGFLWLHPMEDRPSVQRSVAMLTSLGIVVEVLEPGTLPQRFPEIEPRGIAIAVWEPGAGHADPVSTTRGLLERAVELGATAHLSTEVCGVRQLPRGGAELTTKNGTCAKFERVLIAAGPWTRTIAQKLGADVPLTVERHFIASFGWASAPRLTYGIADVELGYYMRPEGRDLFIVGELGATQQVDPDSYDESITFEEIALQAERAFARIPALEAAESRGGWSSLYDVSRDWQPVIGEVAPGVFVDAGTSGHGFKLAPALTKHVAELVLGLTIDPGVLQFHPRRFEEAHELVAGYGSARVIG